MNSSTLCGLKQLLYTSVVVIPTLGVAATLDDSHVAQYALDLTVTDVIDTVIDQTECVAEQDRRREVHAEPTLGAADGTGTHAATTCHIFLTPVRLSLRAQSAFNETVGEQDSVLFGQDSS